jgi:imidazolonepropionase
MTDDAKALLFVNARQVVTCAGPGRARRGAEMRDAGVQAGVAVAVVGDRIAAVAPEPELSRAYPAAQVIDCGGRIITPGFVDSHTHAIFGKARYEEQEMRAAGADYMEIASRGGGIHASVRDLRSRTEAELTDLARGRIRQLAAHGTTTIEVKSGYGLTIESEMRMLRVIRTLASEVPVRLVPTWLGAHEIPVEARRSAGARADYVRLLCGDMLAAVTNDGLAAFADVFCEPGAFTLEESRAILTAARAAGLGLKLHADELRPYGGSELAVELGATSADHLGAISEAGVTALAGSGVVATLLPGTMLFLGKTAQAPARTLIDRGAAVAIASDFNPGTSPTVNFPLIMTLAVSQLHMSVAETIIAGTVNGAAALGIAGNVGQLAAGFSADLAIFDAADVRELPYWYGNRLCWSSWTRGKACHHYELGLT